MRQSGGLRAFGVDNFSGRDDRTTIQIVFKLSSLVIGCFHLKLLLELSFDSPSRQGSFPQDRPSIMCPRLFYLRRMRDCILLESFFWGNLTQTYSSAHLRARLVVWPSRQQPRWSVLSDEVAVLDRSSTGGFGLGALVTGHGLPCPQRLLPGPGRVPILPS